MTLKSNNWTKESVPHWIKKRNSFNHKYVLIILPWEHGSYTSTYHPCQAYHITLVQNKDSVQGIYKSPYVTPILYWASDIVPECYLYRVHNEKVKLAMENQKASILKYPYDQTSYKDSNILKNIHC